MTEPYSETFDSAIIQESNQSSSNSTIDLGLVTFPIELDLFKSICHIVLVSIGVPLNLFIAIVISTFKRLHKKPRNVIWLGVVVCNLLTLLTVLIELLAYHTQNNILCLCYVSIMGVGYTCLLYNLFLALADRYAAIVHPLWHREKVTVQRVIIAQSVGFLILVFIIKFPFIWRLVPLRCGICLLHGMMVAATDLTLFAFCIVAEIVLYHKTRQYFNDSRDGAISVSFTPRQPRNSDKESDKSDETNPNNRIQIAMTSRHQNVPIMATNGSPTVLRRHNHIGRHRRMEMEATRSLLTGVFSLMLFTFPILLLAFIDWGCRMIYGDGQCSSSISVATFYVRELLLVHLVYNSVVYIARSQEFSSTIRDKIGRKWNRRQQSTILQNRLPVTDQVYYLKPI